MKQKRRLFCPYCGMHTTTKMEDGVLRRFCTSCSIFFYENPLPVVSAIIAKEREILLVKRGKNPYKGKWCLPTGFAETGESIENAVLRETAEETGIKGSILGLVDVDSSRSNYYGDLLFLTFEVQHMSGAPTPGDDTVAAKYFPLEKLPRLPFSANVKAINNFIKSKTDYWAIVDSFTMTTGENQPYEQKTTLLSTKLIEVIEENADKIAGLWYSDATTCHSTQGYHVFDPSKLFDRAYGILSQFDKWLSGYYGDDDIRKFYMDMGRERKKEGFRLSEVLSALSKLRKHIWEFALSRGMWEKTIDIYMVLELDRRIMIFFDKAAFYVSMGFEMRK
jgi:ADP-ribose pyrophosphatase YjhB (NUDIX family)